MRRKIRIGLRTATSGFPRMGKGGTMAFGRWEWRKGEAQILGRNIREKKNPRFSPVEDSQGRGERFPLDWLESAPAGRG